MAGSQTRELRHGGEGTPSEELAPSRAGGLWGDGTRLGSSGEAPTVQRARTGGTSPSCRTGLLTAYIQHGPDISIPRLCRSPDFIFLFFFFWQGFSTTPKAALPKPRHHHPCPADAGVSPAGLTCRTRVWMPDTILHLNSCRFAALWHFQGEQGSRVHHFAVIKINLHLHGTWVPPKRRHKWRKGAFLPLLEIPHSKNSAPKNGEGKPSRPPSCGLSCCMHLTEAVSATGGQ